MKVAVIGAGNVGIAIAADMSIGEHEVTLIKTSSTKSVAFDRLIANDRRVYLKENDKYTRTIISRATNDVSAVLEAEVIFITIQSTYHEMLIQRLAPYINDNQVIVCICSYMSSFFFAKYCTAIPAIAETTGPYLEGRIELDDKEGEVVFRVGCRLSRSPMSLQVGGGALSYLDTINKLSCLYNGFYAEYNTLEAALLNPNLVLHTVGAIMSIPRIEFSHGNFCMYREAYARGNDATLSIMLRLDKEKQLVLKLLGCKPVDIFKAGGFFGDPMESFYTYSESKDRAISPTSVKSRYITEDVSQGLVLLESIAKRIGMNVPITTALIDIAGVALKVDFRKIGRTVQRLGAEEYIDNLSE